MKPFSKFQTKNSNKFKLNSKKFKLKSKNCQHEYSTQTFQKFPMTLVKTKQNNQAALIIDG